MTRTHATLALLAALLFPCAQGCRTGVGATQPPAAATAQATAAAPTPYAAPFPARARGTEAFEPFVNLSGGRVFSAREVAHKPRRADMKVRADYPVLLGDERSAAREFNRLARALVVEDVTPYIESGPDPEKEQHPHWRDVEECHAVSYADGEPKVLIPFDRLKDIIDPRGPLAVLAGGE